jgi:mRNA-degrading endonuclease toxin of MazEF toxin-antitoxin module
VRNGAPPKRGEIWEVDLAPVGGRPTRDTRPCLIVSSDAMNASVFGSMIVCPITARDGPGYGWRVELEPTDCRDRAPDWTVPLCWVQTDQIVTVNRASRALRRLATLASDGIMELVDESLVGLLALWPRVMR